MPPARSAIRDTEHAVDAADRTPDTGANCAAYRPCRTMTLVRALVGTALHAIENTLSMRLMRYGE
jgi:hypothetical protein